MSQNITAFDAFCGAGGSSTGIAAAGVEVSHAANHWQLAIDTHATNHPQTNHDCLDLMRAHPSMFPATTIAWFSPECFPAGTLILTKRGLVPIEEVRVGDEVLTHQKRWKPVTQVMTSVKDTIVIRGQGGLIETTHEHPFYVRDRASADPGWVPAAQLLNQTYRWAAPVEMESVGIPLILNAGSPASESVNRGLSLTNINLWWLVGRWLGDGTVRLRDKGTGRHEITIVCGKHEADELEQALSVWKPENQRIGWDELRWRRREIRTAVLFECAHSGLATWLVENFGKLAHGKTIPAWALTMPSEFRKALLAGYVSADGYVTERDTRISSVSKRLALGIKMLATSLGYHASFSAYKRRSGTIEGRSVKPYQAYWVRWENNKSQRTGYIHEGFSWTLIKEIRPENKQVTVYNLSVQDDESYVADGIVVHNCTNHSLAKGRKRKNLNQMSFLDDAGIDPAEERSRATMREVVEFSEYHHYEVVIVENVVDIRYWQYYDDWLQAMINLGYDYKACYLNAMFFGVPQSRDRIYIVFWRKGNKAPNLDFRPYAYCIDHGVVGAVQSWKKAQQWGRYGKKRQYVYCCPTCGRVIEPFTRPAADVIDWTIPSTPIGERQRPLKPKTIARILEGLRRFAPEPAIANLAYSQAHDRDMVASASDPLATQTTRQTHALIEPFILSYMNQLTPARRVNEPMYTIAGRNTPPLVTPPFLLEYYTRDDAQSRLDVPLPTIPGDPRFALVTPQVVSTNYYDDRTITVDQPMPTLTTQYGKWGLVQPKVAYTPFIAELRKDCAARSIDETLGTITAGGGHHALITPFLIALKDSTSMERGYVPAPIALDDPLSTIVAAGSQHALITPFMLAFKNSHGVPRLYGLEDTLTTIVAGGGSQHALITPFVMETGGAPERRMTSVEEPLATMLTRQSMSLVTPADMPFKPEDILDECGFRMLEPEELKRGMSFPDEYIILGNKREQVKQVGNAVACWVAQALVERCVESLAV